MSTLGWISDKRLPIQAATGFLVSATGGALYAKDLGVPWTVWVVIVAGATYVLGMIHMVSYRYLNGTVAAGGVAVVPWFGRALAMLGLVVLAAGTISFAITERAGLPVYMLAIGSPVYMGAMVSMVFGSGSVALRTENEHQ